MTAPVHPWAILLAGGEGTRLRSLTRLISGDARPKQFCPLIDGETLLDRTRRRVDLVVRPDHQVVVVTRAHARYYAPLERELAPGRLVVQPANRGTAPGILYPLLRIQDLAGDVPVALFPSDHDLTDDAAFAGHVHAALAASRALDGRIVLLGIEPERPETEYGWIEPSSIPLPIDGEPLFPIRRFWEKPTAPLAQRLFERGCLWNSFVMVGRVSAFGALVRRALPELVVDFAPLERTLGTPDEIAVAEALYAEMPERNFSDHVLEHAPDRLLAMRVKDVGWCDLGNPARVLASLRRTGRRPPWLGTEFASIA